MRFRVKSDKMIRLNDGIILPTDYKSNEGNSQVLIFEMEIKKVSVTREESRADKQKFAKTKGIN